MQTIQAFKALDGKLFETQHEAEIYESFMGLEFKMQEFFESKKFWTYKTKTYKNMACKFIQSWELWKHHKAQESQNGTNP